MSDEQLTAQQRAERDAHLVKSTDDLGREAAGKPHPVEGHDVRDNQPGVYDEEGRPVVPKAADQ